MTALAVSPALAGLGLGIALAGAPGPVQAVLLTESVGGGVARGLRALAGVHVTFGLLLVGLALGVSAVPPSGPAVRILKVVGGAFLLGLAADALRSAGRIDAAPGRRPGLPAAARGALAIVLNPGGWLFLGAVASPLLAAATRRGGVGSALVLAIGLVAGAAIGDCGVVLLGGIGIRRAGERVERSVRRGLALVLAGLGIWLVAGGLIS